MSIRKSPSNFIRKLTRIKTSIFTICCCTNRRPSRSPQCSTTTPRPRELFFLPRNLPHNFWAPFEEVPILRRRSRVCVSALALKLAVWRTTASVSSREWPALRPVSAFPAAIRKSCSPRGAQGTEGAATVRRVAARRTTASATSTGNAAAGRASALTAAIWICLKIVWSWEKVVDRTNAANPMAWND